MYYMRRKRLLIAIPSTCSVYTIGEKGIDIDHFDQKNPIQDIAKDFMDSV